MSSKRSILGIRLLVTVLALSAVPAQASQYIGEFCWQFTRPGDPDFDVGTFGISRDGDDHYSVNGRFTSLSGAGGVENSDPANGNLEIIGGTLVMTLTTTAFEDVPPGGGLFGNTIAQVRLDPATLSGTFQAVTNLYDLTAGSFGPPEYEAGTVTFLPGCVLP